jgi:hypothetical protein
VFKVADGGPGGAGATSNISPTLAPGAMAGSALSADRVYLMMHSDIPMYSPFEGVHSQGSPTEIAITPASVGNDWDFSGVVFAGCCYGALIASTPNWLLLGEELDPRTVESSIALALLDRGADAFVGFTGLHYVPRDDSPHTLFGAMLHSCFWDNLVRCNVPPAQALFQAKAHYILWLSSQNPNLLSRAIAMKSYWSATCLGLGW